MVLSIDQYKKIAGEAHPDRDENQQQAWAENKVKNYDKEKAEEAKKNQWVLWDLADWGHNAWTKIAWWFDDIISDEAADNSTLAKVWDRWLNVVGWVLWWAVESLAETPRFVKDVVAMPFSDKSEWWWSDVKNRANELQDQWMNRAWAWLTAIDENNDSEHTSAQTVFQLLNNPLLLKWVWKVADTVWIWLKWLWKVDDAAKAIWKVSNVADDATKVAKWAKAWAEVVEDIAKAWEKTSILTKIKNWAQKTSDYWNNTKWTQKVADFWTSTARFIWWPITDAYDIIKTWIKTTRAAMKTTWVWASVMKWVAATLWEAVQTAGKFISKPLSYRTPRLWTTSVADQLIWDQIERWMSAKDRSDFYKEYWYNLDLVWYLNDKELDDYYEQNNIPQDKRLTSDQIREKKDEMWENFLSNFTEWAKNVFEMFDIFSAPTYMIQQRTDPNMEVIRNPRWETIWFSNWKTIDFNTWDIKDADWKSMDWSDLSEDELVELWNLYQSQYWQPIWDEDQSADLQWSKQTWIKPNNITNNINKWAVEWMLDTSAEKMIINSENAWVRWNAVYIINQLNEASKEYVNAIIANYTVDEINKDTRLQQEIHNSLLSYWLLFNEAAAIIWNLEDDDYNDVYRFRKALTAAYNSLPDADKDNIDNNLYRRSIDYNNWLESWFDEFWMKSATFVKRATDKMLNMFWSSETNEWFEQWLSWIAWSMINPELAWWSDAWWEISVWLRDNAAYAVDMVVLNKINDAWIEKATSKALTANQIRNSWNLKLLWMTAKGKWAYWLKWWLTEMSSEFLENFTDAISMVEDPNHDYDFMPGLLFGMFQGALAGYASSTDSYTSFKDYLTRPENRNMILENMWIYVNAIDDPQKKAVVLSAISQLMDDKSPNNLIDIMVNVASQTNNWVEWLMQWYALYQTNKMIWDYTNDLLSQLISDVNEVDNWTPENIQLYFWTQVDPTWQQNFRNYNIWKQFQFNPAFVSSIRDPNSSSNNGNEAKIQRAQNNRTRENDIARVWQAFIKSSFKTAWMSLEEWINYMAPKINTKNEKVIIPINNRKSKEKWVIESTTWDPIKDTVSSYTKTWSIPFTIWDKLWITSDNKEVFWERKSRFWIKRKAWFKNNIKITNSDGTTQEMTMSEYIQKRINEAPLSMEERQFIWTILFKTTVSWLNPYFNWDWSLTKLWEEFLQQVMPELIERNSSRTFLETLERIQTFKEAAVQKSKADAMKESWANMETSMWIRVQWQTLTDWTDMNNIPDDTEFPIQLPSWKNATKADLKKWVIANDNWRIATYKISEAWKLNITYDDIDDDWTPPAAPAFQLQEQQTEQEPTQVQAQEEVQERLNEVATVLPWWSVEVTKQNTDKTTQKTSIPVSVYEHDHQDLEWKFPDVKELLQKWSNYKPYIPYIAKSENTVEFPVTNEFEWFVYPEDLKNLSQSQLSTPYYQDRLPKVSVRLKDWTEKEYSLVFVWEWKITDVLWATDKSMRRHNYFRSYSLVDFKAWEKVKIWLSNTIRPTYKLNDYLRQHPSKLFFENNKTVTIVKEDWSALDENRIISFTRAKDKWKNWQWSDDQWYMSTTLQVERLWENDQDLAFDNKRVFMNAPANKWEAEWLLYNFETKTFDKVKFDSRPVFTMSDVIFNDNHDWITIGGMYFSFAWRDYSNWFELKWDKFEWDTETMRDWFKMLWNKWKTMRPDGSTSKDISQLTNKEEVIDSVVEDMPESKPISEVKKAFKESVKAQNDAVEMVIENAENKTTPVTESVEETIVTEQNKNNQSWYEVQKNNFDSKKIWNEWKIPAVRRDIDWDPNHSFWNPFDWWTRWEYWVAEATRRFYKWLKWTDYQDVKPEQRKWIIDQIKDWSLKWKTVVYYTEDIPNKYKWNDVNDYWVSKYDDKHPNHAMVLQKFINGEYTIDELSVSTDSVLVSEWELQTPQVEQNIIESVNEEIIPEPWDLLALEYRSNEEIWKDLLTNKSTVDKLVEDCDELWITLESIDAQDLWAVVYAYAKWQWINAVIEHFANKMPSSYVDQKLVDILVERWILERWWRYNRLTLSQIIAYNYWLKCIKRWIIDKIVRKTWYDFKNKEWQQITWIYWIWNKWEYEYNAFLNAITDYYISNYFNLNPTKYWEDDPFRKRIQEIVEKKLLSSDIYLHKDWLRDVLSTSENPDLLLQFEKIDPKLIKSFATAAFNVKDEKWQPAPLISKSRYNYLMESNPYMTVIWKEWDYNVWPFWSAILQAINEIPEIWDITYGDANKAKMQLVFDIYSYFSWSRKASYEWLVTYLKKKYQWIANREPLWMLINVLDEDSKKTGVLTHTDWTMMALRSPQQEAMENDPYQVFIVWKTNEQAIIDALIVLEANDNDAFQMIVQYAPKNVKDAIYEKFAEENWKDKSANIAYRIVSWLIPNNLKVASQLKRENEKNLPEVKWDVAEILSGFNSLWLVNSAITKALYQRFWINWLDLNKWTVVLTNNRQDAYWKWMENFENTERFPLLNVSSLNELDLDVNVIVPNWVSIPKTSDDHKYNIIRMDNLWYHDWALVARKLWNKILDIENRMYNIFWMMWFGIKYTNEWFKLTDAHKEIIKNNKAEKSLYWNIFKNNVLPNLSPENRNITQAQFEQAITKTWMNRVWLNKLYKCFAAWDMQEMINNSVAVINDVTQSKFSLRTNDDMWRKSVNATKAITDFSEYVMDNISSNKTKEEFAQMFWDFLMAQMQVWDINYAEWFNQFKNVHDKALRKMYDLPFIKDASVQWIDLDEMFLNANYTETAPVKETEDEKIDRIIDQNSEERRIINLIKEQKRIAERAEEDWNATAPKEWQTLTKEERDNRWRLYRKWQSELAKISDLEDELADVRNVWYTNSDFIQIINETAWTELQQDEEWAKNSSVMSNASEDQNRVYSDKAMKVLEVLYNNFIKNNAITIEAWKSKNLDNHIISEDLLWMLIWKDVFKNTYWNAIAWITRNNKYAYSRRDIRQLVAILSTLKITNPKKFKDMLDDIIITQKDIWYTYDTPEHQRLIAAKDSIAKNPANFYRVYQELSRDLNYDLDFLEWWTIEKNLKYEDVNADWLLQNASKEYFEWSPYVMRTAEWVDNMHEKVEEYHKLYDHYFEWLLPKWVLPADEQIIAFAKMKDAFDNRKESSNYEDKSKVFAVPWIAWAWKTTMVTAFFRYVSEQWGAEYEIDNITNEKQTSIIYNFDNADKETLWSLKQKWGKWYAKLVDKSWKWWEVYIEFEWGDNLINHRDLINMSDDDILDWYNWLWDNDKQTAATILAEKWTEDRWWKSNTTWKIKNFKIVSASDVKWKLINIKTNPNWELTPRKDTSLKNVPIVKSIWDIHFAVRMHQTISSLKATFSDGNKFNWIDYATEWSYMTQENWAVIKLTWYWDVPVVKKQMKWQFIIIDEAQNSYNSDLKAIVEQLWWDNVIVMLWDFHQNSKWDYFENLSKDEQYMVETHRWTKDINMMNEINAFTQKSLIKSNAIWFYMNDSDDFRRYDDLNSEWFNAKPNEYLMVCKTNPSRREINDKYIEALWWMDVIINPKSWKIIQAMVVDVLSDKELNRKWRKSEMPNDWLDMKWFKKADKWEYYVKKVWNKYQLFFPSTDTSNFEWYIQSASKAFQKTVWKESDIEIFVPAFAITTEKESWKTVDNIILNEDVVNSDYDHLSENNAKVYYDAFTRWAKKVYLPKTSPRLIWITREDAENLMKWIPLSVWYVEKTSDKITSEKFTLPVITMKRQWWMEVIDYIRDLFAMAWHTPIEARDLLKSIDILQSYNMWNQTYSDRDMEVLRAQRTRWQIRDNYDDYWSTLKKHVADQWDLNRDAIIKSLYWIEWVWDIVKKIDWIIYGRDYQVPMIHSKLDDVYYDWSDNTEDLRIWWSPKFRNKIVTIDDFQNQTRLVYEWWLMNWELYRPEFVNDNWKWAMKLVPVDNSRRVGKVKRWWINILNNDEINVINNETEKMKIEAIFNHQFGNDWLWQVTINDAYVRNEEQDNDRFWSELRNYVDSFYDRLSDSDLYSKPMISTTHIVDSVVKVEEIDQNWNIVNDLEDREKARKLLWMTEEEYDRTHPQAWKWWMFKKYTVSNEIDDKEETAINMFYQIIDKKIADRDDSDLDQLKSDVKDFVQRVINIDSQETTAWLDTQDNSYENIYINEQWMFDWIESEENCEG